MAKAQRITHAIYPGSFDPVTNGHTDLIERASDLFDHLTVAVAYSKGKKTLFTLEERVQLIESVTSELDGVEVLPFGGLLIDFAKQVESKIVIRGLRAVSDFEYEFQLAWMNRQLDRDIETLFFAPAEDCAFIAGIPC